MTLAMLWVLISHHKGLTLILIVVIALVLIALIPLVKGCCVASTAIPDRVLMAADRRPCILRFRFAPPPAPSGIPRRSKAHKRNENHYQTSCVTVSAQQNDSSKNTGG